jgi:hypothetical protein
MDISQVQALLNCQNRLNIAVIGADWLEQDLNFSLAGAQECSEGIDHLAWKWWKKSKVDIEAAKMEVVDLLHFHLSNMLVEINACGHNDAVAGAVKEILSGYDVEGNHALSAMPVIRLFQMIQNQFYKGTANFGCIVILFERLGGSEEELLALYYKKAVLNHFRAANGYKTGEYRKMWAPGKEDNDFIPALAEGINFSTPGADKVLYDRLEEKYTSVKLEQTH